ncbi:hypothetical protein [uncultured Shewanella sp.]|uniref:hypothetical protein n=1 Tax=uncultured Shewanella sp. TaxID=173975 RepID=UPI002632CF74|nr:hypothetical protein [uncultured Shewanella sp.]
MPSISSPTQTTPLSQPLIHQTAKSSTVKSEVAQQLKGISSDQSVSQSKSLKVEKEGMIYSPFAVKDSVLSCLGHNLNRLKQDKPLYPVILKDDNAKAQFEQIKTTLLKTYTDKADKAHTLLAGYAKDQGVQISQVLEAPERDAAAAKKELALRASSTSEAPSSQQARPFKTLTSEQLNRFINTAETLAHIVKLAENSAAFRDVLIKLEVHSDQSEHKLQQLSPDKNKLYIIGHGGAGSYTLTPKIDSNLNEGITAYQLASNLAKAGLRKDFIDIRTTSCWSADSHRITAFDEPQLEEASKTKTISKPWLFFWSTKTIDRQPFAQEFSDSLGVMGFYNAQVTGYHGQGKTIPLGEHQSRIIPKDSSAPKDNSIPKDNSDPITVRSSKAKHVFTPNLTWEIRLSNYLSSLKDSMLNWFRSSNA